jgi:hypothetical protein
MTPKKRLKLWTPKFQLLIRISGKRHYSTPALLVGTTRVFTPEIFSLQIQGSRLFSIAFLKASIFAD